MKNIVWIASYPKSGNTWFRVFLSNLMSDSQLPVHINDLKETPITSNRSIIDSYFGVQTSELTSEEIDIHRPEMFKRISEDNEDIVFLKTHEAWTLNRKGKSIFPEELTTGVIYIIRNPLDLATSYSFHNNETIEQTISGLNKNDNVLCAKKGKLYPQTQQILTSWSGHVISWIDWSKLPIHVIRYEDMLDSPMETFKSVLEFLKLEYEDSKINNSINNSSFDTLKGMEAIDGFKERSIHSKAFFRKGKSNEWKTTLSKSQIKDIIYHHGEIMKRFGYLKHNYPT